MKSLHRLLFIFALIPFLNSCSTTQSGLVREYDDLYYNPETDNIAYTEVSKSDATQPVAPSRTNDRDDLIANPNAADAYEYDRQQEEIYSESVQSSSGNTTVNNYYYDDYNDYDGYGYDYTYSNRINRFYHPSMTFGYYDPFYSYGYGGFSPNWGWNSGWSINIGYGYNPWWRGQYCMTPMFYDPFWYGPSYGFYSPYYNPYNSFYSPFYSPYNAYNTGYWNGYYTGSYYNNPTSGGGGGINTGRNTYSGPRPNQGSQTIINSRNVNSGPTIIRRETQATSGTGNSNSGNTVGTQAPSTRHSSEVMGERIPRSGSSGTTTQQDNRSFEDYNNRPRSRESYNTGNGTPRSSGSTNIRNSAPSRSDSRYSTSPTPSSERPSTRTYSSPPSRTYSAPSRRSESPTYSAPRRSAPNVTSPRIERSSPSPSRSAPSRSSGSSDQNRSTRSPRR